VLARPRIRITKVARFATAGFFDKAKMVWRKARKISSAELIDVIPIRLQASEALLLFVTVKYADNTQESYAMPVLRAVNPASPPESESSSLVVQAGERTSRWF